MTLPTHDRIPLYVYLPSTKSFREAVPEIFHIDLFDVQILKLEPKSLEQPAKDKASVCIFSLFEKQMALQTYQYLKQLKELRTKRHGLDHDPTHRVLLMAHHRKIPLENWFKIGVNEFIVEPIFPKALAYKLTRHYYRSISGLKTLEQRKKMADQVSVLTETSKTQHEWRFFTGLKGSTNLPATNYGINIEQIHVHAKVPQILFDAGEWVPKKQTDSSENDDSWVWLPKSSNHQDTARFEFIGHKPEFDLRTNVWHFTGEEPELRVYRPLAKKTDSDLVFKYFPATTEAKHEEEFKARTDLEVIEVARYSYLPGIKKKGFISNVYVNEPTNSSPINSSIDEIVQFLENWKPDLKEANYDPLKDFLHGKVKPTESIHHPDYTNHLDAKDIWADHSHDHPQDNAQEATHEEAKKPFHVSLNNEPETKGIQNKISPVEPKQSSLSGKQAPSQDPINSKPWIVETRTEEIHSLKGKVDPQFNKINETPHLTVDLSRSENEEKPAFSSNLGKSENASETKMSNESVQESSAHKTPPSFFQKMLRQVFGFSKNKTSEKTSTSLSENEKPQNANSVSRAETSTLNPGLGMTSGLTPKDHTSRPMVLKGSAKPSEKGRLSTSYSEPQSPFNVGDLSHKPTTHSWSVQNHESDPDFVGLLLKFRFKESMRAFYKRFSSSKTDFIKSDSAAISQPIAQTKGRKGNQAEDLGSTENLAASLRASSSASESPISSPKELRESFLKRLIRKISQWVKS